jgi:hypothetical protein
MTTHIVCLTGPQDTYAPDLAQGDQALVVPFNIPDHPAAIQHRLVEICTRFGIAPSRAASDLLCAAIAAYTGDLRAARIEAYDQWTRDLVLHLAVHNLTGWNEGSAILAQLLSFLTGDHWVVTVRQTTAHLLPFTSSRTKGSGQYEGRFVCLFSGGLDSFIGAADLLATEGHGVLVGHHSAGNGPTSTSQSRALAILRTAFGEDQSPFIQAWVSPPKGRQRASESTTRGRSILFLGLGIAVADGLQARRLIVPENGFISLNVPLTPARLGSFSTRTTHPYLMSLLRQLLSALEIEVEIVLPYQFQTKGEMLVNSQREDLVPMGIAATMSCSHPSVGRFAGARNANQHCGYCVPCIIRRAAVINVMRDPTEYAYPDLSRPFSPGRGSDLRAFRLALDRYDQRPPRFVDVLAAGPLLGDDAILQRFFAVFSRGLDEVRRFLS